MGRAVYGAGRRTAVTVVRLPRLAPELALQHLAALVELFDAGLREPLPIACKTSAAYARGAPQRRRSGQGRHGASGRADVELPGEDEDLEHQLVFGGILPFERAARRGPRFDAYARRLWDDVLDWEQVEHR